MGNTTPASTCAASLSRPGTGGVIADVTIDNPPVNALKPEARIGFADALRQVGATMPWSKGWSSPAPVASFSPAPASPNPARDYKHQGRGEVIAQLRAMKPVAAALHGVALGGGFEATLNCHFRVGCELPVPDTGQTSR
ncbi:MAG TPA: hypothetical protein VL985_04350 [Stellaceae bacterium]|nr:hypothetical protein [Stellaceae bacterium]